MKLFTKNPINQTSKITRQPLTGELVYATPWSNTFLGEDLSIQGDLKEYLPSIKVRLMTAREEKNNPDTLGWVLNNEVVLKQEDNSSFLGTVVHEIQHCLQKKDGRSRGGNSRRYNEFVALLDRDIVGELRHINPKFMRESLQRLLQEWKECKEWIKSTVKWWFMMDNLQSTLYKHLVGEIEARQAEEAVGEIYKELIHTAEEGITGLLRRKGWRVLAYYLDNMELIEEHKTEAEERQRNYWKEENKRREMREKEKETPNKGEILGLVEVHYWKRLGDSYREPIRKPRTNY